MGRMIKYKKEVEKILCWSVNLRPQYSLLLSVGHLASAHTQRLHSSHISM